MLIGEQPGDREDLEGVPFVGPAGRVLRQGLAEAAIDPQDIYMTNAVKHFKWVPKGTRRIHKKPNRPEISACRPWLDAELRIVDPEAILLLGATASQALLGSNFKVTEQRGRALDNPWGRLVVATVHPSSILRALGDDERRQAMEQFVADLKMVASALKNRRAA
jgi:uracil-DNA glycosylase family protein